MLKYLNACTGKNFSDTRFVVSLLKEGYNFGDFITIIDNKMKDEFFLSKKKLFNPRTLFNKEKFDIYKNENDNENEDCSGKDKDRSESCSRSTTVTPDASLIKAYTEYLLDDRSLLQDRLENIIDGQKLRDFIEKNNAAYWVADLYAVSASSDLVVLFHPSCYWLYPELLEVLASSFGSEVRVIWDIEEEFIAAYEGEKKAPFLSCGHLSPGGGKNE